MRTIMERAATLASLALFLGTITVWAQIIATLWQIPEIWG